MRLLRDFEAFIDRRWVMFDPTGMVPVSQPVRIGAGRDAKDVAFATIFGDVVMTSMMPCIELDADPIGTGRDTGGQEESGSVVPDGIGAAINPTPAAVRAVPTAAKMQAA